MIRTSLSSTVLLAALLVACQPAEQTNVGADSGNADSGLVDSGPADSGQQPGDGGMAIDAGPTDDAGDLLNPDGGIEILITSITPPSGPVSGGTVVVIVGSGFANNFAPQAGPTATILTKVMFGNNQAAQQEVSVVDDNTIQLTVPPGILGPADVVISNPNGVGTCAGCFNYFGVVQLNSVTPVNGPTQGGTQFTLTGEGFAMGEEVLFGGGQATVDWTHSTATTLVGTTPPGPAGSADVTVVSANTEYTLPRAFVYVAPITITSVEPSSSPLAGGGMAAVTGTGFTIDCQVSLGTAMAATTYVSSTTLTIAIPPSTSAGAMTVTVASSRETATLPNGFAYFDPTVDQLQLLAVSPQQGPVSGGTCAAHTGCLQLTGSGFPSDGSLEIAVGVNQATNVVVTNANSAEVDLPPASAAGVVSIFARASNGSASLPNSFAYVSPLAVTSISPTTGPAIESPAITATLVTTGFGPGCTVSIGANEATVMASTATSVTVTVPSGSTGPADVVLMCGTPGTLGYQTATLFGGFTYTSPIQILQVTPNNGSIAGNTAVTVYGDGFGAGLAILFGDAPATQVTVVSPFEATALTPPGNVGFVNVTAQVGTASAVLTAGYGYFNPKNSSGGGSGGPMNGILNVTVLDNVEGCYDDPVPGVTIDINSDQLIGTTDMNGEVTFSNASLLKPVNITAILDGSETTTVASIDARDVTLFMSWVCGAGNPNPPPPPPQPPPAVFSGTVCGFKLPPDIAANPSLKPEAEVFFTYPYIYAAPPFGFSESPDVVSKDCGSWELKTSSYGATAIYAVFGTEDDNGNFTPYLMTVQSNLQAVPGVTVNVPLILNMHMDLTVPVTVQVDGQVSNQTFSYLDLGGNGVVPLANITSTSNMFSLTNHPEVAAESVIFLNMSYVPDSMGNPTSSLSFYYERQEGELGDGVTIGPMLPFTSMTTPASMGDFSGAFGWTYGMGPSPDLQQLQIVSPDGLGVWQVVLPGTDQGVSVPPSAVSSIDLPYPVGSTFQWSLITASSPRFDYDYFSYDQLSFSAWTAFTQNNGQFQIP